MATIYWIGDTEGMADAGTFSARIVDETDVGCPIHAFVSQGRMARLYDRMTQGDFLFIQFYAPDAGRDEAGMAAFQDYLERFVNAARNKGAMPVLIAPALGESAGAKAVQSAAQRLDVAYLDLPRATDDARGRIVQGLRALGGAYRQLLREEPLQ